MNTTKLDKIYLQTSWYPKTSFEFLKYQNITLYSISARQSTSDRPREAHEIKISKRATLVYSPISPAWICSWYITPSRVVILSAHPTSHGLCADRAIGDRTPHRTATVCAAITANVAGRDARHTSGMHGQSPACFGHPGCWPADADIRRAPAHFFSWAVTHISRKNEPGRPCRCGVLFVKNESIRMLESAGFYKKGKFISALVFANDVLMHSLANF